MFIARSAVVIAMLGAVGCATGEVMTPANDTGSERSRLPDVAAIDSAQGSDVIDVIVAADTPASFDAPVVAPDVVVPDAPMPIDSGPPRTAPNGCPQGPPAGSTSVETLTEPGPIVRYTVRPFYTLAPDRTTIRDPMTTGDVVTGGGVWLIPLGDTLVADSTQKNAANRPCQWVMLPEWTIDDPYCAVYRLGSTNPFLLRARAEHLGEFTIASRIDGVMSNVVRVRVVP